MFYITRKCLFMRAAGCSEHCWDRVMPLNFEYYSDQTWHQQIFGASKQNCAHRHTHKNPHSTAWWPEQSGHVQRVPRLMEFPVTASVVFPPKAPSTRHAPGCRTPAAETTQLFSPFSKRMRRLFCTLPLEWIVVGKKQRSSD